MDSTSKPRSILAMIGAAFAILGAASRASAAVEARRKPDAATLRRLGIDPAAFTARF